MTESVDQLSLSDAAEWDSAKPLVVGEVQLGIIPIQTAEDIGKIVTPEALAD